MQLILGQQRHLLEGKIDQNLINLNIFVKYNLLDNSTKNKERKIFYVYPHSRNKIYKDKNKKNQTTKVLKTKVRTWY